LNAAALQRTYGPSMVLPSRSTPGLPLLAPPADAGRVLIGESLAMRRLVAQVDAVARSAANVLVTGESGTGKELVARRLHAQGLRRDRPFVAVNCASFPDTLLEAELFGHERGAFTGAHRAREGRFQAAHTGVLFLDEVGELSPSAQAKLLRVLEVGTFEPLGSSRSQRVDVRVVSATHRDLRARIREGRFREDLYYRLKVVHVMLPPLRERLEDLPLLVSHFLRRHAPHRPGLGLSASAWALLRSYRFPGNVRELDNAIQHAVAVCTSDPVQAEHLPLDLGAGLEPTDLLAPVGDERDKTLAEATAAFERRYLLRALRATGGARAMAAERLGISRKSLWEKLRRYKVAPSELQFDPVPSPSDDAE
jgi:two-component system response regulator HydG